MGWGGFAILKSGGGGGGGGAIGEYWISLIGM